jgi:hypothetical protein
MLALRRLRLLGIQSTCNRKRNRGQTLTLRRIRLPGILLGIRSAKRARPPRTSLPCLMRCLWRRFVRSPSVIFKNGRDGLNWSLTL